MQEINEGIAYIPDSKRGKKIRMETVVLVKQFYYGDKFICLMPDKKKSLSVLERIIVNKNF